MAQCEHVRLSTCHVSLLWTRKTDTRSASYGCCLTRQMPVTKLKVHTHTDEEWALGTKRDVTEAVDELERELNVRARCFPRWVADGRMSSTDAKDRYDRLWSALLLLKAQVAPDGEQPAVS